LPYLKYTIIFSIMNLSTIEEAYLTDLAIRTVNGLARKGYNWLKGDLKPYQAELNKVINASIDLYKQLYGAAESDNLLFVDAQIFIEQLVNFQFGLSLDNAKLKNAIAEDVRVQLPTDMDIENFLNIFNDRLAASRKLKQLYIEDNHKDITFRVASGIELLHQKLDELIIQTQKNVNGLEIEHALAAEWAQELETIKKLLYHFKPFTAAELIARLHDRIVARNIKNDLLESQLTFLMANATSDKENFAVTRQAAPLFIRAYRLSPNNIEYKRHACLGYVALQEPEQALALADEILSVDEFDLASWSIKLHYAQDPVLFLDKVPKSLLVKKEFKLNAFFTLARDMDNMRSVFLPASAVRIDITDGELPQLTYSNFKFWLRYSDYLFSRIYFEFPMVTNFAESEELKQAPIYNHYFKLMGMLTEVLKGSEISKEQAYVRFRYHYARLILTGDQGEIHQLARIYDEIAEKDHILVVHLVQAFQLIDTEEYREKSLEIIDQFGSGKHEMIALFKTVILFNSGKREAAVEHYENYIRSLDEITTIVLNNLLQFFRMSYRDNAQRALTFLQTILKDSVFPNDEMKTLLELYVCSIYAPEPHDGSLIDVKLDSIEAGLDPRYPEIKEFYLTTLRSLKAYDRLIQFLRPAPGESVDPNDLMPYCESLYYSEGNKAELLQVLKKARLNLPPNPMLLRLEIELRQKQHDWKKVLDLSEYAIQHLKPHADFVIAFFHACLNELEVDKILAYKHIIDGVEFAERGNLVIFSAFSQAGLHTDAIEVLFKSAQVKSNIASRQAFIGSTLRSGDNFFRVYEEALPGSYVTYKISGDVYNVFIDPARLDDPLIQPFLGKRTDQHFQIYGGFMQETTFIHVIRITDKYLDLYDEILKQASNPVSGLKVKLFQFDGTTAEEMKVSLQKQMGATGTMDKQFRDQNLERYNQGQITFSEVIKSNFQTNPPDAYYHLTGERQVFFQTVPQTVPHEPITSATGFVVDFTSVTLFYELTKEHGLKYPSKFIVSNYVLHKLRHLLNEALAEPEERMSMSITMDAVVPHFFPEDYKEKRVAHLNGLIHWVEENCITDNVDEKLDLVVNNTDLKHDDDDYLHYLVDNRLLCLRQDHLLVSSDLFYLKVFGGQKRIIGPELYLLKYFPSFDAAAYLIAKNYVGLKITKDHLITEFSAFIAGRPNKYIGAVENLKVNRSGADVRNLSEGIMFLKWLYLQPLIIADSRYRSAHYLLNNLLQGLSERGFGLVINIISKQFALLPRPEEEILKIINEIASAE